MCTESFANFISNFLHNSPEFQSCLDWLKPSSELIIPEINSSERESLTCRILGELSPQGSVAATSVYHDLEVFQDYEHETTKSIYTKLNYTRTAVGNHQLKWMLYHPLSDFQELRNRQDIIRHLVTDTSLFNKIDSYLQKLQELESTMLWFWKKHDTETQQFLDQVYFQNSMILIMSLWLK